MTSGLSFLIAAKRCEIAELERLALTSVLVKAIGRLVHGLQRERGLSNLFLASQGSQWASEREDQILQCGLVQSEVRACFDHLDTEAAPRNGHGARLYSRIAYVLQGLDALPHVAHPDRRPATESGPGHQRLHPADQRAAGGGV